MAKDKSPAFQFYPNDWLSSASVSLMTPAEEGAYIRLLAIAWMQPDCGLPDDDAELAILSRLNRQWFKGSGDKLRKKFTRVNGRLFNDRLVEERQKQYEWRKRCSDGGKKGMEHRHGHKVVITTLPENDKVDTSRPLIRDHVRFDNSSSSSSSSSISPNGEIPPNPPDGGLDGTLFDAETPTSGPNLVRSAVRPRRKKKATEVTMSTRQRERYCEYLSLHPKNTIQLVNAEKLWASDVTEDECADWLIASLRQESIGDTTRMFGPWHWLENHLVLWKNGVQANYTPDSPPAGGKPSSFVADVQRTIGERLARGEQPW